MHTTVSQLLAAVVPPIIFKYRKEPRSLIHGKCIAMVCVGARVTAGIRPMRARALAHTRGTPNERT